MALIVDHGAITAANAAGSFFIRAFQTVNDLIAVPKKVEETIRNIESSRIDIKRAQQIRISASKSCDAASLEYLEGAIQNVERALAGLDKMIENSRFDLGTKDQVTLKSRIKYIMKDSNELGRLDSNLILAQQRLFAASASIQQHMTPSQKAEARAIEIADSAPAEISEDTKLAIRERREFQRRRPRPGSVRVISPPQSPGLQSRYEISELNNGDYPSMFGSSTSTLVQAARMHSASSTSPEPLYQVSTSGSIRSNPSRSGSVLSRASSKSNAASVSQNEMNGYIYHSPVIGYNMTPPPLSPSSTHSQPYHSPHVQVQNAYSIRSPPDELITFSDDHPVEPVHHRSDSLLDLDDDDNPHSFPTIPLKQTTSHVSASDPNQISTSNYTTSLHHTPSNRIITNTQRSLPGHRNPINVQWTPAKTASPSVAQAPQPHTPSSATAASVESTTPPSSQIELSKHPSATIDEGSEDGAGVMINEEPTRPVVRSPRPFRSAAARMQRPN